jgi:DNA polymerase iota
MPQVFKELRMLGTSLLRRMHIDLLEDDEDAPTANLSENHDQISGKRWIAHPKTIRLTTRPRPPQNSDGSRTRSFNRISKSGPLPNFVFNLREGVDAIVEKLVQETLIPMFHRLHPEKQGWNLSLMNIGVTNMLETASEDGAGGGRDIGRMFKHQNEVLKEWKFEDKDVPPDITATEHIRGAEKEAVQLEEPSDKHQAEPSAGNEATYPDSTDAHGLAEAVVDDDAQWYGDEDGDVGFDRCFTCGAVMPAFAMAAHERYHDLGGR